MKKLFSIVMIITLAVAISACSSKSKKNEAVNEQQPAVTTEAMSDDLTTTMDSDSGNAGALQTVYFPYNSAVLTGETKSALDSNAKYLKDNTNVKIQIEGHCDERGGIQYNLALGEQRAIAVRQYLQAIGISSQNLSIISYGKERPLEFGHSEDAWAKNRRANFVIVGQ